MFFLYIHCLQVAITMTPEGGSWVYPYIKISSSPYRSLTHQAQERLATATWSMSPTLFKQWCGFLAFTFHKNQMSENPVRCNLQFLSLSKKTRKTNHLQMSLQMQHFLLNYLKTLTLVWPRFEPATSRSADQLTRRQSLYLFVIFCHFSLGWKARMLHGNMTKNPLLRWMKYITFLIIVA